MYSMQEQIELVRDPGRGGAEIEFTDMARSACFQVPGVTGHHVEGSQMGGLYYV
jgi:hypothetical protein